MKKLIIFISIIMICFGVNTKNIFAEKFKTTTVFSEEVIDIGNDSYLIPISISNNTGIMGFKITVSYGDGVAINSISRGSVTKKGNLIDNHLKYADDQYFDVIWNHTKEIKSDGELFIIGLTIDPDYDGEIILEVGYSSPDTFDEQYGNVILDCKNVILREAKKDNQETAIEKSEEISPSKVKKTVSETTQKEDEKKNIEKAKPLKNYKKNKFINKAVSENKIGKEYNKLNGEKLLNAVDETLKEQGFERIEDIPEEKQKEFYESILQKAGVEDTKDVLENDENGKLFDYIFTSYKEQKPEPEKKETNKKEESNNKPIYIFVGLIVAIFGIVFFSKKRKDKKNEEV